jgi:hypothetical protein
MPNFIQNLMQKALDQMEGMPQEKKFAMLAVPITITLGFSLLYFAAAKKSERVSK